MSYIKELGTVAFEVEYMSEMIGMGALVQSEMGNVYIDPKHDPTTLQLGLWLSFVPKIYRGIAGYCADTVARRYLKETMSPSKKQQFIYELRSECLQEIQIQRQRGEL